MFSPAAAHCPPPCSLINWTSLLHTLEAHTQDYNVKKRHSILAKHHIKLTVLSLTVFAKNTVLMVSIRKHWSTMDGFISITMFSLPSNLLRTHNWRIILLSPRICNQLWVEIVIMSKSRNFYRSESSPRQNFNCLNDSQVWAINFNNWHRGRTKKTPL